MRAFAEMPIRQKLTFLIAAAALVTLVVAVCGMLAHDVTSSRAKLLRELESTAHMVGSACSAPLVFRDPAAANEALNALQSQPRILAARLYDRDGRPFASYIREEVPVSELPDSIRLESKNGIIDGRLQVVHRLTVAGEPVGTVLIISDLSEMRGRLITGLKVGGFVLLGSVGLAILLGWRLQRLFTEPLLELVGAAGAVSVSKDYSVRVRSRSGDEFAQLIESFNSMLDQIQKRDQELASYRGNLEEQVAERTAE
ncbi:MAG: HAMP domain-containing protein, partial [Acidobacteria bacterium]|nr:HAMP domain-containing protein [Acidobacteriota bacterium]